MRNIKIILFITILFSVITAFSCNSGNSKSDIHEKKSSGIDNFNQYFPIKDGNTWKYVNEGDRDETELYVVKTTDLKKVDGGIQLKVSTFPYLTKDNMNRTLIVKSNGAIEINDYMGNSGVIIPAAADFAKGYSWNFGVFKGYINSDNDTAVTEDGTYTGCYYVLITDGFTFNFEMWFKEGIGIVKWGSNRTNPPTLKAQYYVLTGHILN